MTTRTDKPRRERIEARVRADIKEDIARAAALQGVSISDFVVRSAHDAALSFIERTTVIRLSARDAAAFVEAIDNPPEPGPVLREAVAEYRRFFGETE